ncbi:YidC/Oxa1 family membrane protein insertase [Occallatibacter riparius]|uniref:Membrane protein insertase YidC n=1 Tax=Occallatibacter riparius TaxID=1002689 RepID=A0A9J7BVV7_9BACT|nr:membrane protein insertase YidC [Occallatibacter riparius]UWZ85141.1 membrane protein insertase YidC [Occallatibacter riparius]
MPEIQNPNFESRNPSTAGDIRSLLSFIVLAVALFFGLQYLRHGELIPAVPASQSQSQAVQTEIARASLPASQSQSIASHREFGWLTFIAKPLYLALRVLNDQGIHNWGWSIVVLTVIFNLLIVWPRVMSMKSSLKMMRVQPKVEALKKRYAHLKLNDPKRSEMNAEMMALYKAEGANMFGGCLPMLLQMPLLFAYMKVLQNAAELHHAHWLWLADLASPDPMHVLPLLIIGSMVLTQCITPTPSMSPSQRWMFALLMPAIWGFSLWHYASGLSLYWVTGNIFNLLVQVGINCSKLGKEMRALSRERAGAN